MNRRLLTVVRATGLALILTHSQAIRAQTNFTLLQSFSGLTDAGTGALLYSGVIQANDGWLYGTTMTGVTNSVAGGTVFKMQTNGTSFTRIHQFTSTDGHTVFAPVMEASDGFLYGTAYGGGSANSGVVYKLARDGSQFAVLHHFAGGADSANPQGTLIEGSDGYLYGTTYFGNTSVRGTVFKINKAGTDYSIIHIFTGNPDGQQVSSKLFRGSDGYLYGTTVFGGTGNAGTVFKLLENGGGYTVIRNFTTGTSGASPVAGVIEASDGWLYGTTQTGGGTSGGGVVYKLEKSGANYTVLKGFASSGTDLRTSIAELVEGFNGVIYGTASAGGISNKGGIFRINKDGTDYTLLRNLVGRLGGGDADVARAPLYRAGPDLYFGTSQSGGETGSGTVFALTSNAIAPRELQLTKSSSSAVLQFRGTGATTHTVESSTNLSQWTDFATIVTPYHGRVSLTNAMNPTATYFRVRK